MLDGLKVNDSLDILIKDLPIKNLQGLINNPIVNDHDEVIGHITSINEYTHLWYGILYGGLSATSLLFHTTRETAL